MLVESLQPFRVWIFKDGLARLATHKYEPPSASNIADSFTHLCNYSLNVRNEEGFQAAVEKEGRDWNAWVAEENLSELNSNTASKRSIRTALLQLRLQDVPIGDIEQV